MTRYRIELEQDELRDLVGAMTLAYEALRTLRLDVSAGWKMREYADGLAAQTRVLRSRARLLDEQDQGGDA